MERMAQNGNIEMSQAFYMEVWNGYERSKELEEENKKLKEEIKRLEFDVDAWYQLKLLLEGEIEKQKEEMQAMERTLDHLGYGERTY